MSDRPGNRDTAEVSEAGFLREVNDFARDWAESPFMAAENSLNIDGIGGSYLKGFHSHAVRINGLAESMIEAQSVDSASVPHWAESLKALIGFSQAAIDALDENVDAAVLAQAAENLRAAFIIFAHTREAVRQL